MAKDNIVQKFQTIFIKDSLSMDFQRVIIWYKIDYPNQFRVYVSSNVKDETGL